MRLSDLKMGERGVIVKVYGNGGFRKRIVEMGFIVGNMVEVVMKAPLRDPIVYQIIGYKVSLRREEASMIEVLSESEAEQHIKSPQTEDQHPLESHEPQVGMPAADSSEQLQELMKRLASNEVQEVILATNSNVEGETTASYLARLVRPLDIKVTRLASGLPVGGELEYADEVTLGRAIESRREF